MQNEADYKGQAAQTVQALRSVLDDFCLKNSGIEGKGETEQTSFFEVTGHTAKITNALAAMSQGTAFEADESNALLDEGRLLCDLIRAELEGGMQ